MVEKSGEIGGILDQELFKCDEIPYNLIYLIREGERARCLTTPDRKALLAQTPGHNAWLWVSRDLDYEQRSAVTLEFVDSMKGVPLPGISGDGGVVQSFAEMYSRYYNVPHHIHIGMQSYVCPKVNKPLDVRGAVRRAVLSDVRTIAEYMAGFLEGAYGITVEAAGQISGAAKLVGTGNLYLWIVDGKPVSMANIAHRSPRHGRINQVYTPKPMRKKGYASALVAELCEILEKERLQAMLYADLKNPDSNKVYRTIGFEERGKIVEIKFS
ncbi:GNAT family N-acetyltransferase [Paenibacillus lutrae]|uniref:GNAT family N-acetyltransferase n=1 Tax=Paenibacillus lutrae TaxID=2078573 RepID=A0A7X3FJS5_9BACL|nr:GNAT family N-acetyltransferase [Paenibacillus lutrae]MVP00617.1 GNAT family N-acetyltransferase [Paenibacillus lutrae]